MTIDIMMPFYGDVTQLMLAVRSVQAQSDPGWRLVVIDDRYPSDEPERLVAGLDDSRIQYLRNDENLGISGNFQRSIDLARAEFTVIMGCDDIMLPGYVRRLKHLIAEFPGATYFQPGVATIDDAGRRTRPLGDRVKDYYRPGGRLPLELHGENLAASLLRGNWTYFPSLCWRTAVLRTHGFRPEYRIVLDLALQLEIIEAGGSLVLDDEVVFEYRRHASASSWSGSGNQRFDEERGLFRATAAVLASKGWSRAASAARRHTSSRLNALAQLPSAVAHRQWAGVAGILRHATGAGST